MQIDKIVIVTRKTRLKDSLQRYNTKQQAKFVIEKRGQSFDDFEIEDSNYEYAKDQILKSIPSEIKVQVIDRSYLTNFLFGPHDLIVTLGQDGLVVNTAKYLNGQPILAINPDPNRFDGILLPFQPENIAHALGNLLKNDPEYNTITMARLDLNDGQTLHAFNDFFIGPKSHTSLLYTITYKKSSERQISSGIIVSTPAGSTGWMSSLFNMARGITNFGGVPNSLNLNAVPWETRALSFAVREPFKSKWSEVNLVCGTINDNTELYIESHMAERGIIFSDGIENDFLEFNSGSKATIKVAEKTAILLKNSL